MDDILRRINLKNVSPNLTNSFLSIVQLNEPNNRSRELHQQSLTPRTRKLSVGRQQNKHKARNKTNKYIEQILQLNKQQQPLLDIISRPCPTVIPHKLSYIKTKKQQRIRAYYDKIMIQYLNQESKQPFKQVFIHTNPDSKNTSPKRFSTLDLALREDKNRSLKTNRLKHHSTIQFSEINQMVKTKGIKPAVLPLNHKPKLSLTNIIGDQLPKHQQPILTSRSLFSRQRLSGSMFNNFRLKHTPVLNKREIHSVDDVNERKVREKKKMVEYKLQGWKQQDQQPFLNGYL